MTIYLQTIDWPSLPNHKLYACAFAKSHVLHKSTTSPLLWQRHNNDDVIMHSCIRKPVR